MKEGLNHLRRYLSLDKFKQDITVNKNDILMRIEEIKHEVVTIN